MTLVSTAGRSVPEWVGKTADTAAPPRVRLRVFQRCDGRCDRCGRRIGPGEKWTLEHLKALINGGQNRETNLRVTCSWCLPAKNAEDVAEKSRVASVAKKHWGIRERDTRGRWPPPGSRPFPKRPLSARNGRKATP